LPGNVKAALTAAACNAKKRNRRAPGEAHTLETASVFRE
jgi:hypothetical protein